LGRNARRGLLHLENAGKPDEPLYRDKRLEGFDAAVVEVVEHLDPPRQSAFER
jgi:hypothetical protein